MLSHLRRRMTKLSGKLKRSIVKRGAIARLLRSVPADAVILEVGGGYNPRYVKAGHPNVYHLDHASTEQLRAKFAADPDVADRIDRVQPIDFVFDGRPIENLVPPELRFDLIYGSHVLEHQVDLIGHLQSLEKLLKPGGRVIEMIPDLRTCFDALRFPTVTSDVLVAHQRGAPTHRGKQVFDFLSRQLDKNHGFRMSDGDFEGVRFAFGLQHALQSMQSAELPGTPYLDTHAWTFTPESFRLLMIELRLLGLVRLVPTYVSSQYGNQFCVVLEPANDGSAALSAAADPALDPRQRASLGRHVVGKCRLADAPMGGRHHRSFLDHHHTVVVVHRMHGAGEVGNSQAFRFTRMPGMQPVDEVLAVLDERTAAPTAPAEFIPIRGVQVFAQVHPVRNHQREQCLEGSNLLLHGVPAVVDQDVDGRQRVGQRAQELAIALVANEDLHAGLFEALAVRVDVDAEDLGLGAEVVAPHLHRPALRHPELHDVDRPVAKPREVAVVDLEIVIPLVNQPAGVLVEELLQVVGRG